MSPSLFRCNALYECVRSIVPPRPGRVAVTMVVLRAAVAVGTLDSRPRNHIAVGNETHATDQRRGGTALIKVPARESGKKNKEHTAPMGQWSSGTSNGLKDGSLIRIDYYCH